MYERMGFVMPASGRFFGAARPKGLLEDRHRIFSGPSLPCVGEGSTFPSVHDAKGRSTC
jgi:hypothetical protein